LSIHDEEQGGSSPADDLVDAEWDEEDDGFLDSVETEDLVQEDPKAKLHAKLSSKRSFDEVDVEYELSTLEQTLPSPPPSASSCSMSYLNLRSRFVPDSKRARTE